MAAMQLPLERTSLTTLNPLCPPAATRRKAWLGSRAAPQGLPQTLAGPDLSQLADKFYIVLMVFLIDQHLLLKGQGSGVLAEMASDYGLDISTRTQVITLLATGILWPTPSRPCCWERWLASGRTAGPSVG